MIGIDVICETANGSCCIDVASIEEAEALLRDEIPESMRVRLGEFEVCNKFSIRSELALAKKRVLRELTCNQVFCGAFWEAK